MDYVGKEAAELAKHMEKKLSELSSVAGILFVGIKALPSPDGRSRQYEVILGLTKNLDPSTGVAIVKETLKDELVLCQVLTVSAYRGVLGAAAR